jgi:toxin ParE1/3/4
MKLIIHELAEIELNEAAQFYESEVSGLGEVFLSEAERSMQQICDHPNAGMKVLENVRRKLLRRFPYSVMYLVMDDVVQILAIANQKRRPFYWRDRI